MTNIFDIRSRSECITIYRGQAGGLQQLLTRPGGRGWRVKGCVEQGLSGGVMCRVWLLGHRGAGPGLALRDTGNYVTGAAWHYKRDDQADTCCDPNPGMSGHNRD